MVASRTPASRAPRNAGGLPAPDEDGRRAGFRRALLRWYGRHRRDLPWRLTRDPYRVLVSEVMLQQTQVDRVIPKYHEFLRRYPTLPALAQADVGDVRRTWYPLGYNIRPVRLHGIAREAVARYGGRLPEDEPDLLAFPGIGRYTAGAVRAFAYGQRAAMVDTNVRRVLGRVFHGADGRQVPPGTMWALAERVLPRRAVAVYDFNQALMDFGATWCTARAPRCRPCPLRRLCRAYPRLDPDRRTPAARSAVDVAAAVIARGGRYLVARRPPGRPLAGRWEFPGGKRRRGESLPACLVRELEEELGVRARVGSRLLVVPWRHRERRGRLHVFRAEIGSQRVTSREGQAVRWASLGTLAGLSMPAADRAVVAALTRWRRARTTAAR